MRINEDLKLVVPARTSDSGGEDLVSLWAYHNPISREVFETHYRAIAATKTALLSKGLLFAKLSGPHIATLALMDEGAKDAQSRGEAGDDLTPALLAEIKRLTMILVSEAQGYAPLPVDTCLQRGLLDPEEWAEVESSLVFFTCLSSMTPRRDLAPLQKDLAGILTGRTTSLGIMEFSASLKTSTPETPPGGKQAAASSGPI
ncbi:MAG: hypothetical protein ACYDBI_06120 [Thermoplasmataceae archaeon]